MDTMMTEGGFWELVARAEWYAVSDVKHARHNIEAMYTRVEIDMAYNTMRMLENKLSKAIVAYEDEYGVSCGLGDDSYGDMIAHIIGLGRVEYYAHLSDRSLVIKRARTLDFVESFAYVFQTSASDSTEATTDGTPAGTGVRLLKDYETEALLAGWTPPAGWERGA